ncbi:thiosulfate oxidation carrier protein SoxY [Sulfurovum riftiae]|uniref:Thiosulfate oxidation carrier protein SoxY n=1 Tax=Sulfurovum riftiae TaxID=1630136 RepID=A0A151CDA1_9BACT|nr:thiosulfate oxidation carrier protein SoxY [Sulfurovum riftiae]KYJ85497.1 thiosulfate oxidation carrier protein SoxY [Sulfurovum riftiae]
MKRRNFIKSMMAVSAVAVTPVALMAKDEAKAKKKGPNDLTFEAAVKAITGGKEVKESDKIKLTVPEIAENGAVVPVKVEVDHPMEEANYVKAIHVLNTKNGNARCADVMLTPANGRGYFATRVKLGSTQEVVALVELSDGTFIKTGKSVKVTIGGCG